MNKGSPLKVTGGIDIQSPRLSREREQAPELEDKASRMRTVVLDMKRKRGYFEIRLKENESGKVLKARFRDHLVIGRGPESGQSSRNRLDIAGYGHISSSQCTLYKRKEKLWIRDRHSANGTHINSKRVEEGTELPPSCEIKMADTVFYLEYRLI